MDKKEEDYVFEIEMGANINLEQKLYTFSLMSSCPDCGCCMDELSYYCSYCGYINFKNTCFGIIR